MHKGGGGGIVPAAFPCFAGFSKDIRCPVLGCISEFYGLAVFAADSDGQFIVGLELVETAESCTGFLPRFEAFLGKIEARHHLVERISRLNDMMPDGELAQVLGAEGEAVGIVQFRGSCRDGFRDMRSGRKREVLQGQSSKHQQHSQARPSPQLPLPALRKRRKAPVFRIKCVEIFHGESSLTQPRRRGQNQKNGLMPT